MVSFHTLDAAGLLHSHVENWNFLRRSRLAFRRYKAEEPVLALFEEQASDPPIHCRSQLQSGPLLPWATEPEFGNQLQLTAHLLM